MKKALALALAVACLVPAAVAAASGGGGDDKILGGRLDQYPDNGWVTALMRHPSVSDGSGFDRQFCGGSLVAPDWVLTAAHCVVEDDGTPTDPSTLQIMVGEKNLNGSGGETRDIDQNNVHPNYNPSTNKYDAALLHLASPVSEPAALVIKPSQASSYYRVGKRRHIFGWGDRNPDAADESNFPTRLYYAKVPIASKARCKASWGSQYSHLSMFCAGYRDGSPDTCKGDSGGPVALKHKGFWRVIGITSFGFCGQEDAHGVYTRVSAPKVQNWLVAVTGGAIGVPSR